MTVWCKQSTARTINIGPFLDSGDANTHEEGLTIGQADIRLSKNGGAWAQTNNAAGATHTEHGWYSVPLDATDTGTLGHLRVYVHVAGALAVWDDLMVCPANVWDSFFGADALQVDATQWNGTAVHAPGTAGVPIVEVHDAQTVPANVTQIAGAAVNTALAQLGVNVVTQANIDFGALQKASLNTATPASVTGAVGSVTAGVTLANGAHGGAAASLTLGGAGGLTAGVTGNITGNLSGSVGSVTGAVGSVTGNVGGNVTGSVGSVAAGGITAGSFAAGALSAAALAAATANKLADHVLRRTFANARASADGDAVSFRSLLGGVGKLVNRIRVAAGVLTIYAEDDATALGTQTLTTDVTAQPIVEMDT